MTPAAVREALAAALPDRLLGPGDADYDTTRQLFNGMHDRRPALIALPTTPAELQATVRVAADAGLPTAVRCSGHNVAGTAGVDGGLVIDLRHLGGVSVDPRRRLARVQGGATWAAVDAATSAYGLAVTGGTFDTTGVAGLTLGGGIGHLMGRLGLACDNVVRHTVVTATSERLVVDPGTDPELDWALRGAGHGLGVVEEFTFRLHPVSTVCGGFVAYPARELAAVARLFRELAETAPDDLICILLFERYGPEQVPAAVLSVCYCGTDEEFVASLHKQLRRIEPLDWQVDYRPYLAMQQILGRLRYGLRHYWSARCTSALPDTLIDALVDRFWAARWRDPFNDTVYVEEFHGAVRSAPVDSAVPFREARFNVTGMAIWEPIDADEEQVAWARSVAAVAEPWAVAGDGYLNYNTEPSAGGSVRALRTLGPDRLRRLRAVKRRVDPGSLLPTGFDLDPRVDGG